MAEGAQGRTRRIPWLAGGILLGVPAGLLALRLLDAIGLRLPPCLFKQATGWPCATCGLTRMARALAEGDLPAAFHWHPVAASAMFLLPLAAAWDVRRAWRGEAFPELPDRAWARASVAVLFVFAWALQALRGI
jgi:hypothetical protein